MAEIQEGLCERIDLRQLSVFDGAAGLSESGKDRSGNVGLGDIATYGHALAEMGTDQWSGWTFAKDGARHFDDPENVSEGLWEKIWTDDAGMAGGITGQTVGGKQTEAGGFIKGTATEAAGMDPAGIEL